MKMTQHAKSRNKTKTCNKLGKNVTKPTDQRTERPTDRQTIQINTQSKAINVSRQGTEGGKPGSWAGSSLPLTTTDI